MSQGSIWRAWTIAAVIISMVFAPLPRVVRADPPPTGSTTASYATVYVTASEAEELTNGSLSPEQLNARLLELRDLSEPSSVTKVQDLFAQVAAGGTPFPAPVGPNGEPIGPPVRLPEGPNGEPNPWKKVPGTPERPWKWVPTRSVPNPGGGQPGGSWDPKDGHWDVDNGRGVRTRWLPDGTSVGDRPLVAIAVGWTRWLPDGTSVGEDHKPTEKPEPPPEPFTGVDPTPYIIFGIVIIIIIIVVIGTGGAAAPAIVLAAAVPAGP
jgi:hypothetical protein